MGEGLFLEVWVQTTDPNGLSSGSLDLSFNPSLATAVGITASSVFPELTHGTIDNAGGQVDDLSGSHLGPCTDAVAVTPNWARVAVVEFRADAAGVLLIEGATAGSEVYGTAICGVGDIDPGTITFDSVTVTVGDAAIPAVSTWGLVAMTLLLLVTGTLVVGRRQWACDC